MVCWPVVPGPPGWTQDWDNRSSSTDDGQNLKHGHQLKRERDPASPGASHVAVLNTSLLLSQSQYAKQDTSQLARLLPSLHVTKKVSRAGHCKCGPLSLGTSFAATAAAARRSLPV